jgi:tetratricopeptide (TPR) repeat protein
MPERIQSEFSPGLSAAIDGEAGGVARELAQALELIAAGDLRAAEARLRKALESAPGSAPTQALLGLLFSLEGRIEEEKRWLDRAAESADSAPWPRALRGTIHFRRGALEDARKEFDAAVDRGADPSVLELRSQVLSDLGFVVEAIQDIDAMIESQGPDPRLYFRRALYHMQRRKHPRALRDLQRAITADPKNAAYVARRGDLYIMLGRLADAQVDTDAAVVLAPKDIPLRVAQLRLYLMRGEKASAAKALSWLKKHGGAELSAQLAFYQSYAHFKGKRYSAAAKGFKALLDSLPERDSLAMKTRFYWLINRLIDPVFMKKHGFKMPERKYPKLFLYGLGMFPPYDTPVDELHGLVASDVLFNNLPHPEVRELLHAFQDDVRSTTYDAAEDEFLWADRMGEQLKEKRVVSFVTRGHPLMFGRLACECVRRAKNNKTPYAVMASPTSVEVITSRAALQIALPVHGIQLYNIAAWNDAVHFNTQVGSVVNFYWGLRGKEVPETRKELQRFFPPEHPVLMFGPKYDTAPVLIALKDLEKRFPEVHASLILYVPPLDPVAEPVKLKALSIRKGGTPKLVLSGLGVFGPPTTPLDVLHSLSRCDEVLVSQPHKGAAKFLKEFCTKVRDVPCTSSADEKKIAESAISELARGKHVGLCLRGYPVFISPAITALTRACIEAGIEVETHWTPGPMGILLAREGIGIGDHIQAGHTYDLHALQQAKELDADSNPIILALPYLPKGGVKAVAKELGRFFPADRECAAFGPDYHDAWVDFKLGDLAKTFPRIRANLHIVIKPKQGYNRPTHTIPGMPGREARHKRTDA